MKQKELLFGLLGLCLLLGLISCSDEDRSVFGDDFEIPELTDNNTIQFTVDATGEWKQLQIVAGGGKMAIEWGDGRLQKIANPGDNPIMYKYGNSRVYQVRIWAEEIDICNVEALLIPTSNFRLGYFPKMKTLLLSSLMNTSKIDLSSSCPNVEVVSIGNCPDLELLDIDKCPNLKGLQFYTLPKLSSLKLGEHPVLEGLSCTGCSLQSLSLKGLPSLNYIFCYDNPQLSTLEFDDGLALSTLRISGCAFRSLDFLSQLPLLTELSCGSNQLTELDLSQQPLLYTLDCSNNRQLESVLIPENNQLRGLECNSCNLDENALNSIFDKLIKIPADNPGYGKLYFISYYKNPGENLCNKELIKGWAISKAPSAN